MKQYDSIISVFSDGAQIQVTSAQHASETYHQQGQLEYYHHPLHCHRKQQIRHHPHPHHHHHQYHHHHHQYHHQYNFYHRPRQYRPNQKKISIILATPCLVIIFMNTTFKCNPETSSSLFCVTGQDWNGAGETIGETPRGLESFKHTLLISSSKPALLTFVCLLG